MSSSTRISNMALGHLGQSKRISEFNTDKSAAADTCRLWYPIALDEVLRDFSHPFLTKIEDLGLVEEDPNSEWGYSYRYPSNCLMFRRILSGIRNDSRQTKVPYRIAQDGTGKLIFTDQSEAQAEWSVHDTDMSRWPVDLRAALALLMAFYMAPSITAGDPFKLGDRAFKAYELMISKAKANALNEQQDEEPPESEAIRARR